VENHFRIHIFDIPPATKQLEKTNKNKQKAKTKSKNKKQKQKAKTKSKNKKQKQNNYYYNRKVCNNRKQQENKTMGKIIKCAVAGVLAVNVVGANGETYRSIDVESLFAEYAISFCGNGNVHNADVGMGKINMQYHEARLEALAKSGNYKPRKFDLKGAIPAPKASGEENCQEDDDSCQWSDDKGHHWCNYDFKCMGQYAYAEDFQGYEHLQQTSKKNVSSVCSAFVVNQQTTSVSTRLQNTGSYQDTYSWTTFSGVKGTKSQSMSLGIPAVFGTKQSGTISFAKGQSTTTTQTEGHTISVDNTFSTPPQTSNRAGVVIDDLEVEANFTVKIRLPEYARLWCSNEVEGHHEYFIRAVSFVSGEPGCGYDYCEVTGTFFGRKGQSTYFSAWTCPAGCTQASDCPPPISPSN